MPARTRMSQKNASRVACQTLLILWMMTRLTAVTPQNLSRTVATALTAVTVQDRAPDHQDAQEAWDHFAKPAVTCARARTTKKAASWAAWVSAWPVAMPAKTKMS